MKEAADSRFRNINPAMRKAGTVARVGAAEQEPGNEGGQQLQGHESGGEGGGGLLRLQSRNPTMQEAATGTGMKEAAVLTVAERKPGGERCGG